MKVSPGTSPWMKDSSTSPSIGPRRSFTFSSGNSTMVPTFMRNCRATIGEASIQRPSGSSFSRCQRS